MIAVGSVLGTAFAANCAESEFDEWVVMADGESAAAAKGFDADAASVLGALRVNGLGSTYFAVVSAEGESSRSASEVERRGDAVLAEGTSGIEGDGFEVAGTCVSSAPGRGAGTFE